MESTIVSMTDETGKTGNVDYRDCHFPSDAELVEAARRYGLERGIRFTITTVVGAKTKFVANIEQGKLVHVTPVTQNLNALERICESVCTQEVERLSKYKDFNFNTSEILDAVGISEEEVWSMVESKKSGLWMHVPKSYEQAMFNCVLAEYITDQLVNGTIPA